MAITERCVACGQRALAERMPLPGVGGLVIWVCEQCGEQQAAATDRQMVAAGALRLPGME